MSPHERSRPVTQEEIVDTAVRLIDEDGLDALTMRRLGADLGVDPMMIYRHVPNKDALLDLAVDRIRADMRLPEPHPDRPAELMETIFVEYRRVLDDHPNMVPLATRRTDLSKMSGLEFLIEQGLSEDDAVELFQSLVAFTIGFSWLGSPATAKEWTRFPEHLAERLGDWKSTTFRRVLRFVMAGYGLTE